MNHRWRGSGLAFLIVVGALVLGAGSLAPAFADEAPKGSIGQTRGDDGYVKDSGGNDNIYFSIDAERSYVYPASIQDPSNPGHTLTLYFANPYAVQLAQNLMADGTGELHFTRPAQTGTAAPTTTSPAVAPAPAPTPTTSAAVTSGNPLARLARLLTELEQNIKFSTQTDDWDAMARALWVSRLTAVDPTSAELTAALQALELSLKSSALAADWQTQRAGWYTALRSATTPAQIAELMKQLELPLPWEATEEAWRTRRDGWLADVRAAGGIGAGAAPAPTTAATATTAASIARLAELLSSLEQSVKPELLVGWATERAAWAASLQRAASVADLKAALQAFEVSIKTGAQQISWVTKRDEWYTGLRAATTPAHLAARLRELEASFKSEAMGQFYPMAQGFWRVHVDEVSNGTYVPPAVSAPAPTAPAPVTASAAGGNLPKLAALLKELEAATNYQAQVSDWSDRRPAWQSAVVAATTLAQLRESLLAYEASLKGSSYDRGLYLNRWRSEVRTATTADQCAGLLKELETNLHSSSVTIGWPGRREAWRAEVATAGRGGAPAPAPASPAPAPSAPAPAATNLSELINDLVDMESHISSWAKLPSWKEREREGWLAEVKGATTVEEIGNALLTLELGIRPDSFWSDWSSRRSTWRSEVEAATTAGKLQALTVDFEEAIPFAAWDWY